MEIEEYDTATGEVVVINESGLPDSDVIPAVREQIRAPEIAAISRWVSSNSGGSYRQRKQGTLFDRDRFATPELIFDKFRTAADAARVDGVVAGVCETTEQLAFKRLAVECDDLQQEDNVESNTFQHPRFKTNHKVKEGKKRKYTTWAKKQK